MRKSVSTKKALKMGEKRKLMHRRLLHNGLRRRKTHRINKKSPTFSYGRKTEGKASVEEEKCVSLEKEKRRILQGCGTRSSNSAYKRRKPEESHRAATQGIISRAKKRLPQERRHQGRKGRPSWYGGGFPKLLSKENGNTERIVQ